MTKVLTKEEIQKRICGRSEPHIYSFRIASAPSFTKIGDTYRPLYMRKSEWEKIYGTLDDFTPYNAWVDNEKSVYVRDYSIHGFLKKKNGESIQMTAEQSKAFGLPHYSQEFFMGIITPDDVDEALLDIKKKYDEGDFLHYDYYKTDSQKKEQQAEIKTFGLREDQKNVVEAFYEAYKKGEKGKRKMLLYAVMRFGKSFTAMQCALRINAKRIVIVSAKKDVIAEWEKTVKNHIAFKEYNFYTTEDLATTLLKPDEKYVVCLTLQGLQKEIRKREQQIFKFDTDLLIIDEAHYGVGGDIQGRIVTNSGIDQNESEETEKDEEFVVDAEALEKLISDHKLKVDTKLFLSGTPYHILWSNQFDKDNIIAAIRYVDIIDKKHKIAEKLEIENKPEWDNEYYGFPEMTRFAFNLDDSSLEGIERLKQEGYSAALSELFAVIKRDSKYYFVHENNVLDILKAIDGKTPKNGILDLLNFQAAKENRICRHIVMTFNQKAMCDAMESLIDTHKEEFYNLSKYKIIKISSREKEPSIEDVKKTITSIENSSNSNYKGTLSLTVRRMMTGVTVPEWDTMIMFKSTKSPEEYDQAIFRLQSSHTRKIYDCKDAAKYVIEDLKPQTIVVDFDINRMFHIQEYSSMMRGFGLKAETDVDECLREKIEADIGFAPIISVYKDEIRKVEAVDIVKEITKYSKDKGIIEDVNDLPFDIFSLKENDELLQLILNQEELRDSNGSKLDTKAFVSNGSTTIDLDKIKQFLEDQETNEKSKTNTDKKERLSSKDKANIDGIKSKYKMYVAKLLFFAFLSDDKIEYHEDILKHLDSNKNNIRISEHLGLTKSNLTLFFNGINRAFLAQIDAKIANANQLSRDNELEGVDKLLASLNKFNRFSDSEISTPLEACSQMLETINKDYIIKSIQEGHKILDIASKHGEFAYSICELLKNTGIDYRDSIYSIPTSDIAYEFTLNTYKQLDLPEKNIATFTSYDLLTEVPKKNKKGKVIGIDYEKIKAILSQNKPFNTIKLIDDPQQGDVNMIQFDAVVGNPPYQLDNAGDSKGKDPIYHFFMDISQTISSFAVMIHPARFLFNAGKTPKQWNNKILNNKHLEVYRYFDKSTKVFTDVDIKGGVAITVFDESKEIEPIGTYVQYSELGKILKKVKNNSFYPFSSIVSPNHSYKFTNTLYEENPWALGRLSKQNKYNVTTNAFDAFPELFVDKPTCNIDDYIKFYGRNKKHRLEKWIQKKYIKVPNNFNSYRVIIARANGNGDFGEVLVDPFIAIPQTANTDTFLSIGNFTSLDEAKAACKYISTKFVRALLGTLKVTHDNFSEKWSNVPIQDFTTKSDIDWTLSISKIDELLFNKYNLDDAMKEFIDSMVESMTFMDNYIDNL